MYKEGFKDITNIDYSKQLIEIMEKRYSSFEDSFKCKLFLLRLF